MLRAATARKRLFTFYAAALSSLARRAGPSYN